MEACRQSISAARHEMLQGILTSLIMSPLTYLPGVFAKLSYCTIRLYSISFFFLINEVSNAQGSRAHQKLSSADTSSFLQQIAFIKEGPDLVARALDQQELVQIRNFVENWEHSETASEELIFCINVLLDIQQQKFSVYNFPCEYISLLEDYKKEWVEVCGIGRAFHYTIWLDNKYWYDATEYARKWIILIDGWAESLLDSVPMSGTEKLFCEIIAGRIQDPTKEIQYARRTNPDLKALYSVKSKGENAYQAYQRDRHVGTAGILAGSWFPTGNLNVLGIHPSAGFYLGARNRRNEYDFIYSFRFLNTAVDHFKPPTNDSSLYSYHFDGGYIGFDYSRYIVSKPKYEIGLTTAVAYDYFNIVNAGNGSQVDPNFHSIDVGSFDFSNGIRVKYFVGPKSFLGLFLKYHLVNYCYKGGIEFGGNAFTIDLVYGSH